MISEGQPSPLHSAAALMFASIWHSKLPPTVANTPCKAHCYFYLVHYFLTEFLKIWVRLFEQQVRFVRKYMSYIITVVITVIIIITVLSKHPSCVAQPFPLPIFPVSGPPLPRMRCCNYSLPWQGLVLHTPSQTSNTDSLFLHITAAVFKLIYLFLGEDTDK